MSGLGRLHPFGATLYPDTRVYRAPGRVNLIGEHTDYNDGLVMPAAIDLWTFVAVTPRADGLLSLHSLNLDDTRSLDPAALAPQGDWTDYVAGVVWALRRAGVHTPSVSIAVRSDLPLGAGLSSSAALEVAVACALLDHAGVTLDRLTVARLCQQAENEFVGARCGLMDQFAVTHGRQDHALVLDCRSLTFTEIQLPPAVKLVICNTMIKHAHAAGDYNRRRHECEAAVQQLRRTVPSIRSLRDVSVEEFTAHEADLPAVQMRRVRHVLSENQRVSLAALALAHGDLSAVGALMAASHRSLRDDYEVSCRELDLMVELSVQCRGVHGARMTGGGFGGCTINLVAEDATDLFAAHVGRQYLEQTGITPEILVCAAADGVERILP